MGCNVSSISPNNTVLQQHETEHLTNVLPSTTNNNTITSSSGLVYQDAIDNSQNLFSAIKRGNITLATELIVNSQQNVNNLLGMWNSTPLIVAIQYRQIDIINLLLKQNNINNINHCNDKGGSALLFACMEGMTEIVSTIL